ncbi:MAG TPA: hypothetical protein VMD99_02180 [Terriglobales bacterium]|nr:hypothetical protein [Terriglobales bacterium]
MTDEDTKRRISEHLGLGLGLFLSIQFQATSTEYEIRNGLSRLYYAFFHASLAFLMSQGENVDEYRRAHGDVHSAIDRRMGKYFGRFIRELYRSRQQADYEPEFFGRSYGRDIERARADSRNLMGRANRNFYWIYNESRKAL